MMSKAQRDQIAAVIKLEQEMVALGMILGYLPVRKGVSAALIVMVANPLNMISLDAPMVSDL